MNPTELRLTLDQLVESLNALYARQPQWREKGRWPDDETGAILRPPTAPPPESVRLAEDLPCPPSYRRFLDLHDGLQHGFLDFTLRGYGGAHSAAVARKYDEYVLWQREDRLEGILADERPETIEAWERRNPANLFLRNHPVLGTNFAGSLLMWDRRTLRPDGEMEVVYWSLDCGVWDDRRFGDFFDVLRWGHSTVLDSLKALDEGATRGKKTSVRRKTS